MGVAAVLLAAALWMAPGPRRHRSQRRRDRAGGLVGGHAERAHRMGARPQFTDEHIERGFQRMALAGRAPDAAPTEVTHAHCRAHDRAAQNGRQRQ